MRDGFETTLPTMFYIHCDTKAMPRGSYIVDIGITKHCIQAERVIISSTVQSILNGIRSGTDFGTPKIDQLGEFKVDWRHASSLKNRVD